MQKALDFVWQGWRESRPNPCVGALAVKDGQILGVARSAPQAGMHAEAQLVRDLGEKLQGAELYVTLEPCSHFGRNPPCAPAVALSGVKRVVVACMDPNPAVSGRGIALLESHGIEVRVGVLRKEAEQSLSGFFHWIQNGQPEVWLKAALGAEGEMAMPMGPLQITGRESKLRTFELRSLVDAVLIGGETLRKDKPSLNVRTPGFTASQPMPIVWTRKPCSELPLHSLFACHEKILVVGTPGNSSDPRIECLEVNGGIPELLLALGARGLHRILVEAGPHSLPQWLNSGQIQRYYEARSPDSFDGAVKVQVQISNELVLFEQGHWGKDLWSEFRQV